MRKSHIYKQWGEPGGGGYFLFLTLSELCLLLYPDKLLHHLTWRQAGWQLWGQLLLQTLGKIKYITWIDLICNKFYLLMKWFILLTVGSSMLFCQTCQWKNIKLSGQRLFFLFSYPHVFPPGLFPLFPTILCLFCRPLLFSSALFSLVNTIAQAVSCCRHFVADHGAESLLPSNCQSVHFMVHIPCSPFVRVPLAPALISLTPSPKNNNKSNAHLFYLTVSALPQLSGFQLRWWHVLRSGCRTCCMEFSGWLFVLSFCTTVFFSEA